MCRLFIVEDEEIIREGIQKNIDWESKNVKIVGTASNGKECLEKIEICMPEVILSDIKMPFMDGMELIQHVYELYPKIKVVLLTAFDEFEYAKKALNYKVCQYVMKYEENDKILDAVLKAQEEYTLSFNQNEMVKQGEILIKNKILRDLLFQDEKNEEVIRELSSSTIRFLHDNFLVICILLRNKNGSEQIKNIAAEYNRMTAEINKLEPRIDLYFCKTEQKLCIIVNIDKINLNCLEDFKGKLEELLTREKEVGYDIKATVGQVYQGIDGINKSYKDANYIMSLCETSQYVNKEETVVITSSNDNVYGSTNRRTVNQIIEYIRNNYQEKALCLETIAKNVHLTPTYVSAMFKKENNINISDYIIKIRIERAKYLLIMTDMKTYEISEEIGYVNSQYFSVLFKRNTGTSPTEYRQRAGIKSL